MQENWDFGRSLAWILVVSDYWDVFIEELPGLPPTQENYFVVKLYLRIAPISIAPYHMIPVEK